MSRFVIVSFAFLGLAFYEISGGSDFAPPERPDADPPHRREVASGSQAALDDKFQRPARLRAAELVVAAARHQPMPTATAARAATTPARPQADPEQRQTIALAKIAASGTSLQSSSSAFAATAETGLLHMDAAQGGIQGGLVAMTSGQNRQGMTLNTRFSNSAAQQPAPPPEAYLDIRQIRASRVNMRQGPGTIYPVMGRLLAGDKVLVIEDSGTGWLHLRTQKGNKIGWVAASLVSKKAS